MMKIIRSIIGLLIVFGIGYLFGLKGVKFYEVISRSMEPTLSAGDRVIAIKPEKLKRKDIVVINDPEGEKNVLIKRIIGLPGEKIMIKKGNVYINNVKISEPYIKEKPRYILIKKIPENHYFLLGDNRNDSKDSSVWGPVPKELIIGKIVCLYWPLKRFKLFLKSKRKRTFEKARFLYNNLLYCFLQVASCFENWNFLGRNLNYFTCLRISSFSCFSL